MFRFPLIFKTLVLATVSVATLAASDPLNEQPSLKSGQDMASQAELRSDTSVFDFGRIYPGKPITHTFSLVNHSQDKSITIDNLRSDCGCSVTLTGDKLLTPGTATSIQFSMDSDIPEGPFSRKISVDYSVGDSKQWIEITVKGELLTVVRCQPTHVYFKKVMYGEAATEHVTVIPVEPFNLLGVRTENNKVQVSFSPVLDSEGAQTDTSKTDPSSSSWDLTVTIPATASAGKLEDTVILSLDHPEQSEFRVIVKAVVRSSVSVNPTQIYLGSIEPGEERSTKIKVSKTGDATLRAPTVKTDLNGVTWNIEEKKTGADFEIRLVFKIPEDSNAQYSGIITVMTSDPTLPEFEVPVFGYRIPVRQSPDSIKSK